MRVRLEKPSLRREREFLAAARRSRAFQRRWAAPPATAQAYRAYVRRLSTPAHQGYFVVLRKSGDLVGAINLNEIVRGFYQGAYLGCYAFLPYAGRGYMSEGIELVLRRAFGQLRLHRVEANIQPGNETSLALFQRLGFRREGYSPRYLKIAGRWRDHERWALLAEEWRARKPGRRRPKR
jgi:ribosomal-protein-alanine N-acetyltransferase